MKQLPLRWTWTDYLIFALSIFLVFGLVFSEYLELPPLVGWMGRWHPLVLHFPIVLILLAAAIGLSGRKLPPYLLTLATLTALVTAISGLLLATASGVKGPLLLRHQWLGGATALAMVGWYWIDRAGSGNKWTVGGLQLLSLVLVAVSGHYGGMVTHGEDFLDLPKRERVAVLPEDPLVYRDLVMPILERSCVSCHNPNKQKGELLMTDLAALLRGGKSGKTVIPGDPERSELMLRLRLPRGDEKHMPPDGKAPLSQREITILSQWVALGAGDSISVGKLPAENPLVPIVAEMREGGVADPYAELPPVTDTTLVNLRNDYLTINRLASGSPALLVNGYLPPIYDSTHILALERIAPNVVGLDLSGLPLGPAEMSLIGSFTQLRDLELDRTGVSDPGIAQLKGLTTLKTLKLYQTPITDSSMLVLATLPELKNLYLWDTRVTEKGLTRYREQRPEVRVISGIDTSLQAFFALRDSVEAE